MSFHWHVHCKKHRILEEILLQNNWINGMINGQAKLWTRFSFIKRISSSYQFKAAPWMWMVDPLLLPQHRHSLHSRRHSRQFVCKMFEFNFWRIILTQSSQIHQFQCNWICLIFPQFRWATYPIESLRNPLSCDDRFENLHIYQIGHPIVRQGRSPDGNWRLDGYCQNKLIQLRVCADS